MSWDKSLNKSLEVTRRCICVCLQLSEINYRRSPVRAAHTLQDCGIEIAAISEPLSALLGMRRNNGSLPILAAQQDRCFKLLIAEDD